MSPRKKSRNSTGYKPAKNRRHCNQSVSSSRAVGRPHGVATEQTYVRIQEPSSSLIPKDRRRHEQDQGGDEYEQDGVVEIHGLRSISREVQPHEQSKQENEETGKL